MSLDLRKCLPKDYPTIVDLLTNCFPHSTITEESFTWKHFDRMFADHSRCQGAFEDDHCRSVVCFVPVIVGRESKKYEFFSCAVQATHESHRRQGLVSKLTQQLELELPKDTNYLGFSNADGVKIDQNSKTINYQIVGQFSVAYWPALMGLLTSSVYEIKSATTIPEDFLYKRQSSFFEIQKSPEYVDWRFARNPKRQHQVVAISLHGEVVGYCWYRTSQWRMEVSQLIMRSTDEITPALWLALAKFATTKAKLYLSFSYLNNSFWQSRLPGFTYQRPVDYFLTVKSGESQFLDQETWLLQGGDIQ